MALYFNSQSIRSSALGAKWSHSYFSYIVGTNPAVVVSEDGTETSYTLAAGHYVAPAGVYDSLVKNADNTCTLTIKGGNASGTGAGLVISGESPSAQPAIPR